MTDRLATARRRLRRLVEPVFLHRRFGVFELDLGDVLVPEPPPGVEIRAFTGQDWPAVAAAGGRRSEAWLRRWVPRGLRGHVAYRGGRLIGHGWYATSPVPQPHLYPGSLPEDAIVLPWVWVDARERGRGVASALLGARADEARRAGFRRAWMAIEAGNEGPVRELARATAGAGPRRIGELTLLRVLGVRRRRWRAAGPPGAD
jgi:GNAT superfamily N-acetyltransferase